MLWQMLMATRDQYLHDSEANMLYEDTRLARNDALLANSAKL